MVVVSDLIPQIRPWVRALRQRSHETARHYESMVNNFFAVCGEVVDSEAIERYMTSIEYLAPASRVCHMSAVKSFFNHCRQLGIITTSPDALLIMPRVEATSQSRYLTIVELRLLIHAAKEYSALSHATVMLLAGCGLRVNEACNAHWGDLFYDEEGRMGLVVRGKGGKSRVVKVREDVFKALAIVQKTDELDAMSRKYLLKGAIPRRVQHMVKRARIKAGIEKAVSPHYLRHTHATLAAVNGASIYAIQAALGHSSINTSARYIHWAKGLEETTVDYFPELAEKGN